MKTIEQVQYRVDISVPGSKTNVTLLIACFRRCCHLVSDGGDHIGKRPAFTAYMWTIANYHPVFAASALLSILQTFVLYHVIYDSLKNNQFSFDVVVADGVQILLY